MKRLMAYLKYRSIILLLVFSYMVLAILNALHLVHWMPPCLIKLSTGLECFGCGTNRSLMHLFDGNVAASLETNPMGLVLIGLLLLYFTTDLTLYYKNNQPLNYGKY